MSKQNEQGYIELEGVHVNNLDIDSLRIPRGELVVLSGLSGSGKSSLAFDTLYAEGHRRYVQSLSSYARQFLDRLPKPDARRIAGIPPAIVIEQRVSNRNPRSTVGTMSEIYEYLCLLYARVGRIISPTTGQEIVCHTTKDVTDFILSQAGKRIVVLAPIE
ncbi:MAG: excinuclease ABC subunit A, partial [Bacteroides sp.]